jgi:transcriptional regulator with XRE-family HTH domain
MRLGSVIRKWRVMSELGTREAAKLIGLDHATLSRIERGYMPSADSLRAILIWLMSEGK